MSKKTAGLLTGRIEKLQLYNSQTDYSGLSDCPDRGMLKPKGEIG